jgi:hypothetical protein
VLFVEVDVYVDAAGKILKRQRVASTPEHFRQSLAEFSGPMKAGSQLLLGSDVRLVE